MGSAEKLHKAYEAQLIEQIGETASQAVLRFLELCPSPTSLPMAPASIAAWMASKEAQSLAIWERGSFKCTDTQEEFQNLEAMDTLRHLTGGELTQEFLISFLAFSHGYFATQFFLKGHFTPHHVELHALKLALLKSQKDPIEIYAGGESGFFITIADYATRLCINATDLSAAGTLDPLDPILERPPETPMAWMIMRSCLQGSVLWKLGDTLTGRTDDDKLKQKIFLSYSRSDLRKAKTVRKYLEQAGFSVWIDEKDIPVGASISRRIGEGIASEASYFVLLLSRSSLASEWVAREVDQANLVEIKKDKLFLLPLRIDEAAVPEHLEVKRYADGTRSLRKAVQEILAAIKWAETKIS